MSDRSGLQWMTYLFALAMLLAWGAILALLAAGVILFGRLRHGLF